MRDELTITTTPELGAVANHSLVKLCMGRDTERWLFARYYEMTQARSETLLSLSTVIEHWRTTPYDVLFQEMSA